MPLYVIPVDGGTRNKVVCIPKPPKIGSALDRTPKFRRPFTNTHNPDQDWVQSITLYGSLPRRGLLDILENKE